MLARLNARGFRLLMLADALVLFTSMAVLTWLRISYSEFFGRILPFAQENSPTASLRNYAIGYVAFTLVFVATYYFGGMYERELRLGQRAVLPQVASLTFGAWLIVALVELFSGEFFVPRTMLPALLIAATVGPTMTRWLSRQTRRRRLGPPKVLLVGAPDDLNLAHDHLKGDPSCAIVVGQAATSNELLERVEHSGASEVLLLSASMLDEVYPEPLETLERRNVGVLQRVSARDTLLGLEGVREIAGMPFVALRTHTLPISRARFKRAIELVVLLIIAVPALILSGLAALYVRIVAGSPVLFWQDRVGRDNELFRMVKFRTMHPNAEEGVGAILSKHGDPRVIPACQWLRSTRLDELPQLWNVFKGEMSIVGPRPERPELTAQFEALIPGYARRHEIPPGITGLAQIHGRYHTDPEYKLGHDLQYLVNWSPVLDLQILLRTVWVILARRV